MPPTGRETPSVRGWFGFEKVEKVNAFCGLPGKVGFPPPVLPLKSPGNPAFSAAAFLRSCPCSGPPTRACCGGSFVRRTPGSIGYFSPWGQRAACTPGTAPAVCHNLRLQLPVCGQDGGAEVPAEYGAGEHLWAGARLIPIVQQKAVAAVAVGAQGPDQPSGPAKLGLGHTGRVIHG